MSDEFFPALSVELTPALPRTAAVDYADAVWIGAVDEATIGAAPLRLRHAQAYRTARLLVRRGRVPRGLVELPIVDGGIDAIALRAALAALPVRPVPVDGPRPPISVVLCTYDRPELLAVALQSLQQLDYPEYEVVVVDNHPASGLTAPVVRALADPRMRIVEQPEQGLSRARNLGVLEAADAIVAFTDDDTVVDRYWLQGLADGFVAATDVACVTGNVLTGEIVSEAQRFFDARVSWGRAGEAEVFALKAPPPGDALFPFSVGRFGTGANFAVRRDYLIAIGGFDEAFGAGAPTSGGEDIDLFVRVLVAGLSLAYEPNAIVWHRHRLDDDGLSEQLADYGRSLGAWITKLLLTPRTLPMVLRRTLPALRQLRRVTEPETSYASGGEDTRWRNVELRALLRGPWALARGRVGGSAQPLRRVERSGLPPVPDGAALPSWAMVGAACGLVAAVAALPVPVRAVLLLAFIAVGPGAAVVAYWEDDLPRSALRAVVPVTSLAVVTVAVTFGLFLGWWSPRVTLLGLAFATGATAWSVRRLRVRQAQR